MLAFWARRHVHRVRRAPVVLFLIALAFLETEVRAAAYGVRDFSPFTRAVGVGRAALALATLATVTFTPRSELFFVSENYPSGVLCDKPLSSIDLFCLADEPSHAWATGVTVVVCMAVLAGLAPAFTCVPHAWVAWSFNASIPIPDGGDQVVSVMTLLLVPMLILDRRATHWHADRSYVGRNFVTKGLAYGALVLCTLQVAVIYFNAAIAKFAVEEWANGSVLWYWIQDPGFEPPEIVRHGLMMVMATTAGTLVLGYSVLLLELILAASPLVARKWTPLLLGAGCCFHVGIAVTFGLWSFCLAMVGALVIALVRPGVVRTGDGIEAAPKEVGSGG
jgi:antimicrobial peptide system SdpB family protein